jgi:ActR/RegA family two-component response regulator
MMLERNKYESDKVLLIIEDFDFIRNLVGKFFQFSGYSVVSVAGVQDALQVSRSESPSIVMIDYEMKRDNPYRVISAIRDVLQESYLVLVNDSRNNCNTDYAMGNGVNQILPRAIETVDLREIRSVLQFEYAIHSTSEPVF